MFLKLLAGPHAAPFKLRDTRNRGDKKLGKGYQLSWERKDLPGAGAQQYAWETLGLPPYAVFGFGNINVTNPLKATAPANYVFQAVGVVGNPPTSLFQGQFTTQPLMDVNAAEAMGVVVPGAVSGGPNAITKNAPVLSP